MSAIGDKIRKSRESVVEVGGVKLTIRRPTELDMMDVRASGTQRAVFRFVVGWEGMTEGAMIEGGDPHPLPFDQDACAEWLGDNPEYFATVVNAILTSYGERAKALEDAKKN